MARHAVGHHPEWRRSVATPEEKGLTAESVCFKSEDGLCIHGSWLPASAPARGVIVLAHGQGGNRSHMLPRAAFLVHAGYHVLAIDLRAHGESEGNYMTPGFAEARDVLGAAHFARRREKNLPIVLMGYSYGAVAVLHAGAQGEGVSAVIADAAFVSAREVMHRIAKTARADPKTPAATKVALGLVKWPGVLWLAGAEFYLLTSEDINGPHVNAIHAAPRIKAPAVLLIAGEKDAIAPPCNSRRLYDALGTARKELRVIPDATHDTYTAQTAKDYEPVVLEFLSGL